MNSVLALPFLQICMIACVSHVFVIFIGETFDNCESFPCVLSFEYEVQSLSPLNLLSYMVTAVYIAAYIVFLQYSMSQTILYRDPRWLDFSTNHRYIAF